MIDLDTNRNDSPPQRRPIEVGLVLPQIEGMMEDQTARWSDLSLMATLAEQAGFDSIWTIDHLLLDSLREPGRKEGLWECWSLLSALGRRTLLSQGNKKNTGGNLLQSSVRRGGLR